MKTLQDYHHEVATIRHLIAEGKSLPESARKFIANHGLYLPHEIIKPTFEEVNQCKNMEKLFELPAFCWYAHEYLMSPRFANFWLLSSVRELPLRVEHRLTLDESLCRDTNHPIFQHLDKQTLEVLWHSYPRIKIDAAFLPKSIYEYAGTHNGHAIHMALRDHPDLAHALLAYVAEQVKQHPIKAVTMELLKEMATGGWHKQDKEEWRSALLTHMQNTPSVEMVKIAAQQLPSLLPKGHADWVLFMDELKYRNVIISSHANMPYDYPDLFKVVSVPAISTANKRIQQAEWASMTPENRHMLACSFGLRGVGVKKLVCHQDPEFIRGYEEGATMRELGMTEMQYRQEHYLQNEETMLYFE